MSEYARREFERLQRAYQDREGTWRRDVDRCPDHLPQAAISQLARSHSKMTLMVCPGCGAEVRQFDWLLPQQKKCQVCDGLR